MTQIPEKIGDKPAEDDDSGLVYDVMNATDDIVDYLHHQLQQSRHSLYTSLVAAVEGLKTYTGGGSVNDKDKRINKQDLLTIINSIFKE